MTPTYKERRANVKVAALTFAQSACAATTAPVTVRAANQWNPTLSWGRFLGLRKANRIYGDCDPSIPMQIVRRPIKDFFRKWTYPQRKSNKKKMLSAILCLKKSFNFVIPLCYLVMFKFLGIITNIHFKKVLLIYKFKINFWVWSLITF